MKLSCQEGLVPGEYFADKLANLDRWGYEGVELSGHRLRERLPEIRAALADSPVRASTVCGGFSALLLSPDRATREKTIADMEDLLACAAEAGALGLIFVPIFGKPQLPDLSPLSDAYQLERALLIKLLRSELAPAAERSGALLLLEPLNRYEAHIPPNLKAGVEICQEVDSPAVKLMADFFHMSIEEADLARSLAEAGDYVQHVHLADSNRSLPGLGHTEFAGPFAALKKLGYQGYMALECRVPAPAEETLPAAARFLRQHM